VAAVNELPPYRLPRTVVPRHYDLVFKPDFTNASFDGEAAVKVEVLEATAEVVLNAAELEVSQARLVGADDRSIEVTVTYRHEEEQLVLGAPEALAPGPWRLDLRFAGRLNDRLRGFYRSKYKSKDGQETWLAATQFESTDARRAFPCWDEPDFKATFGVTVVAEDGLTVLGNAREISSEVVEDGKRRTRFADTLPMSTYIVAVVIGPFELSETRNVDGVPLRIGSVPGRGALRAVAEEAAVHALSFLSSYFSMPYPADKLDHVGIPDFAAGAMENLGLVTYRETALLVAAEASQVERQRVVSTIAHETAHMWFGDLVTMRWWEGIWLNEAFATFMELLVADAFEPAWQVWTNFGVDRAAALAIDSLHASRPIEYPVGRPEEADNMFDSITYDKGGAVLRMIERYLGEETFRRGLNIYLDKHRFSNTDTTDLWDALEIASGQPVQAVMGTWVNQAGHPMILVERTGPSELRLSQSRFFMDGAPDGRPLWAVPLTLRYATADGAVEHRRLLLEDESKTVVLEGEPAWAVVNENSWGVYRTRYDEELVGRLYRSLDQLGDPERLSLVADTWAATVAGLVPLDRSLELWSLLGDEQDPDVWWAVSGGLGLIELVAGQPELPLLQRLVGHLAGGAFREVGWEAEATGEGAGESPRRARLRSRLVTLLGVLGADAEVGSRARHLLAAADAGGAPLAPDLATAVAQVVAASGTEKDWELLYSHYKNAATPQDEVRYLHSLAGFPQPAEIRRTLNLVFSGEVRSQDAPYLLAGVLARRAGSAAAWEAIEQHWDEMLLRWPQNTMHRVLEQLPALVAAGDDAVQRASAWLDSHPVTRGELKVRQSRERLHVNQVFKARVGGQLRAALTTWAPGAP
jgi:puromycin-sensitive aminopeptidase